MKKLLALLLLSPLIHSEFSVSDEIVLTGLKGANTTPDIYDCKNRSDCIYFQGEIAEGDFIEFEKALIRKIKNYYLDSHTKFTDSLEHVFNNPFDYDLANYKRIGTFRIFINSVGGNVSEALKIAKLIRELELHVILPMDGKCFSACFYLYSAGVFRLAYDDESIGIHSPSFEKKFFNELSQEEANLIYKGKEAEAYDVLRDFNIPEKFISQMKSVPSQELHFLSLSDVTELIFDRIYNERLISFNVNTKLDGESSYVDDFELRSIMRMLLLKNLSKRFPDLIKKNSLFDIIADTSYWNALNFSLLSKIPMLNSDMTVQEKMQYFSTNHPREFLTYASIFQGIQQAIWYEVISDFDRSFQYETIAEDMLERGLLRPEVKTLGDAKKEMLDLAFAQSFIPLDEL